MNEENKLRNLGWWLVRKLIWLSLFIALYGIAYLTLSRNEKYAIYVSFFERTPPKIKVLRQPDGLGTNKNNLVLEIQDNGTGLDEVVIRADQDGDIKELHKHFYPKPQFKDVVEIPISGRDLELSEGDLDLVVSVFDRSFWSNGTRQEILLRVNYQRPRLEVLSAQHNAVIGGSELCFYRLSKNEDGVSGVKIGDIEFLGYPAHLLDAAFEMTPDVYFAYFAIPLQFDRTRDPVRVFARNREGNETTTEFYYKAQTMRRVKRIREVDPPFLEVSGKGVYDRMVKLLKSTPSQMDDVSQFQFALQKARPVDERAISAAIRLAEQKSSWTEVFTRPAYGPLRVDFGDLREYQYNGQVLGQLLYTGAEYSTNGGVNVTAAAPGKVKFVGPLGVYGNAVIVDHGFGLSTLYGYLSSATVKVGDEIASGQTMGSSGTSGILDTPGFFFEMRVHGVPVRPEEWWDRRWVRDHILNKVQDQKKLLGLLNKEEPTEEPTAE